MKLRNTLILNTFFYVVFTSFFIFGLISCAKKEVITDLDFQKNLLSGTGGYNNTFHIWKVDSMNNNGVVQNVKSIITTWTFYRNGNFERSDGYKGIWQLPTLKDLSLKFTGITPNVISNKFQIVDLNSAQLHIKYDSASVKQDVYLIIIN